LQVCAYALFGCSVLTASGFCLVCFVEAGCGWCSAVFAGACVFCARAARAARQGLPTAVSCPGSNQCLQPAFCVCF
jgi:hypothetical protein